MKKTLLLGAVCACIFSFISMSSHAALVDNGTYTTDTSTGLDWLDLTETMVMSHNDILANTDLANAGWQFATEDQYFGLVDHYFGITLEDHYDPSREHLHYEGSPLNEPTNTLVEDFIKLFGDTYYKFRVTLNPSLSDVWIEGKGLSIGWVSELDVNGNLVASGMGLGRISDCEYCSQGDRDDFIDLLYNSDVFTADIVDAASGHWLVRTSAVPIPPALWLFGSGLLGLIGVARKKTG